MSSESNLNQKILSNNEMDEKGQFGIGRGVFGLPIAWTRRLAVAFLILGLWLFVFVPTLKEIGFIVAGIGGALLVIYS